MIRTATNPQRVARLLLSLLAAAGVVWGSLQPQHQAEVVAAAIPQEPSNIARDTLRVGMWTLWHDREVTLSPTGPNQKFTLRTCADCAALSFSEPAMIRAEGGVDVDRFGQKVSMRRRTILAHRAGDAHGAWRNRYAARSCRDRGASGRAGHRSDDASGELCGAGGGQRKRRGH